MEDTVKLRVAVLGTRGFPNVQGGIEKHCQHLYTRLVRRGCHVVVYARKGYVNPALTHYQGVQIIPLWAPRDKRLEALTHTFLGILRVISQRGRFDLIHIHGTTWIFVPLARLSGRKVVVTSHGPEYDRKKWGHVAKAVLRLGEFLGARFATTIIAVSQTTRSMLKEKYGRDATYIPNGVEIPGEIPATKVFGGFPLQPRSYVLSVGRLVPEKGFHDLLEAFAHTDTDYRLVIAGGADHEDAYSRSLKRMAADDPRVLMTGRIAPGDLTVLYSNAAFFVSSSYHEGLSISVLEAMSHQLPVLASRIPANLELVRDEQYTFLPGRPALLASMLAKFIEDGFPPDYVAENSGRVKNEFNWDSIADQTLAVYLKTLGLPPS
jgi:glycosyltransferase involved in cell wall biosynthesis